MGRVTQIEKERIAEAAVREALANVQVPVESQQRMGQDDDFLPYLCIRWRCARPFPP
jgi:hypothetical protein